MIKLYVDLVLAGKKTIEQVPAQWRIAVVEALKSIKQK